MAEPVRARGQAKESRRPQIGIPRFSLYGEAPRPGLELLHIEEVQSRAGSTTGKSMPMYTRGSTRFSGWPLVRRR